MQPTGFPIVLTADRVLLADYPTLLDGMTAASQTTGTPAWLMRRFVAPPAPVDGLHARKAPLGLRLLEAALLDEGFIYDVAIVPPEHLKDAIGARTRLVAVSSGDPLGLGMNDSTMSAIAGGLPYTPLWLAEMCGELRRLKTRFPQFKVVLGGPGAWQVEQNPQAREQLGIDAVFCGYGEEEIVALARAAGVPGSAGFQPARGMAFQAMNEHGQDAHATTEGGQDARAPSLRGPTSMGVVEISRGCGLGCSFCTIHSLPMRHLPIEKIVRDVCTNVDGGVTSVCLISEDFLRYGADGNQPDALRVLELAHAVRQVKGLRLIQLDHVNISSVARFPDTELRALHDLLAAGVRHEYLWVNLGVESASGALLAGNGGRGKLYPFSAGDWERVCAGAIDKLIAAGFMPMVSLVLGLPGETEAHIRQTLNFVQAQHTKRLTVFPLFYAPIAPGVKAFALKDMTPPHWELLRLCYDLNFKWLPKMFWDNQRGAGVPWLRRALVQCGGWLRMRDWRWRMRRKAKAAARG